MVYQVAHFDDMNESRGFSYHPTHKEAEASQDEYHSSSITIETSKTPKTKQEIIALLNLWGGHNDNG